MVVVATSLQGRLAKCDQPGGGQHRSMSSNIAFVAPKAQSNFDISFKNILKSSNEFTSATQKSPYMARLVSVQQMIPKSSVSRATFLVTMVVPGWEFVPGVAFGVAPVNPIGYVLAALDIIGLEPSTANIERFSLLNLLASPTKMFIKNLAGIIDDPILGVLLQNNTEYQQLLEGRVSNLDLINSLSPESKATLLGNQEKLVTTLGPISPRHFSVCNSSLCKQHGEGAVQFLFNVPTWEAGKVERQGLATSWVAGACQVEGLIPVFPRVVESFFRVPSAHSPIVMICAGTGIAPFVGFLEHRRAMGFKGKAWLYFGIRSQETEYLFKEQLALFLADGTLDAIYLATSREGDKQYVQHIIDTTWLFELMQKEADNEARIFLCGDELGMIKEVNQRLLKMAQDGLSSEDLGSKLVLQWSKEKRLLRDIWV